MSRPAAYLILAISIIAEQIGTVFLEASHGWSVLHFSVLTVILYAFTYYTFCKILNIINLAVAYATWTAVGSVGATLFGVFLFRQPMSIAGWISIAGMVVGVFLLNCYGTPREDLVESEADPPAAGSSADEEADEGRTSDTAGEESSNMAGIEADPPAAGSSAGEEAGREVTE